MKHVHSTLQYFLLAEVPVLIVSLALLAWGIDAISDAKHYVDRTGRWSQGATSSSYTTTSTGQIKIYTPSTYTTHYPSRTVLDGSTLTTSMPFTRTVSYPYTTVFGTTTAELFTVSRSFLHPPAEYTRLHPSQASSPTPAATAHIGRDTHSGAGAGAAPLRKRFTSWGEGYSNRSVRDGLYQEYSDSTSDLFVFLGTLGACLAAICLRLASTLAYLGNAILRRKTHKGRQSAVFGHMTNLVLACSTIGSLALIISGVIGWSSFADYRDVQAADVRATLAFWVLTSLTSSVVVILSATAVHKNRGAASAGPSSERYDTALDSSSDKV